MNAKLSDLARRTVLGGALLGLWGGSVPASAAPPGAGNVLVFDADPFLVRTARILAAFDAPDWTSDPGPVPGPVTTTVERWDGVSGWVDRRRVDLGTVDPPALRLWVNQLAPDIVFFSFAGRPAPGFVDSDGNGLPDAWELRFFGRIGVDPNADTDGDGVSNRDEYLAGTNPVVAPAQPLEIEIALAAGPAAGEEPVLRFAIPAQAPEARLEVVNVLGDAWTDAPAVLRVVGGQRVLELPFHPGRPAQFFRWRR